jgi:Transcription factor WhiB
MSDPGAPQVQDYKETDFMSHGLCRYEDPKLFDTMTRNGVTTLNGYIRVDGVRLPRKVALSRARRVCFACPVLLQCIDYIEKYPSGESIWAGLLPEERNDVEVPA